MAKGLVTKSKKEPNGYLKYIMGTMLLLLSVACVILAAAYFNNRPVSNDTLKQKMAAFGEVTNSEPVGNTGMTAWVVKLKDTGQNAVFYSTKDGKAFIDGTIFSSDTGQDISTAIAKKFNVAQIQQPAAESATPATGAKPSPEQVIAQSTEGEPIGKLTGEVPQVIKVLDSMPGFKEDKSMAPEDTIYVVYDPRCPYCHKLFEMTRNVDLKGKGITIKWLPSLALGDSDGKDTIAQQAAYAFEATSVEDFAKTFSQEKPLAKNFNDEAAKKLALNLSLLYEAADKTYGKDSPKSVPAVFYLNKKNGVPKMLYGATEPNVFSIIFGK